MSLRPITLRSGKKAVCAFCKYWYDPTNEHIAPKFPKSNIWEYDPSAICKCLKSNTNKRAILSCPKYECKVNIN